MRAMAIVMHTDALLVIRAQANDRRAFNEIVLRYKGKVYNFISRMAPNPADAEDLTQETFVRAYTSIRSFQSRASLNTWLFRIATNLCVDQSRRAKSRISADSLSRSREAGEEEEQIDAPDARFDPQRIALNTELGERLDAALLRLPEKLRCAALLYDIEGLSYEEIAQVVGAPLGTVKSRIFNARAQLRDALGPYLRENG